MEDATAVEGSPTSEKEWDEEKEEKLKQTVPAEVQMQNLGELALKLANLKIAIWGERQAWIPVIQVSLECSLNTTRALS